MEHKYNEDSDFFVCDVCGLFEGSLTTDCPGEYINMDKGGEIYKGLLDYRENEGGWVNKINPTNQMWVYGKIHQLMTGNGREVPSSEEEIIENFRIDREQFEEIKRRYLKDIKK